MGFLDDQRHHDLPTVLSYQAQHRPDRPWILSGDQAFSYQQVDTLSGRLAQGLSRIGLKFGDTVLCMSQNRVEQVFLWCALSKCGAPLVPVNTHYRGNIFAYLINDSLAETIAIELEFLQQLVDVADDLLHLKRVILIIGEEESLEQVWEQVSSRYEVYQYLDLLDETVFEGKLPGYRDLMGVFYTSGTTGPSKGVTMTHAHAFEYARGVTEMLELRESDVYCSPLPLFHIAGLLATVYAAGIVGASTVIVGPFSVGRFWQDVEKYHVTTTFLLGAMANFIYKQPLTEQDNDNSLERVLMVPLIPEVETFKNRFGCRVSTTWGGTEMNCPTQSGFDLPDNKTCGQVIEDRYEVRIVDEFDHEVPDGTPGEALVRTKVPWIVTNGYWQHPEWTAALLKNQWIHTGDMISKDHNGNLYFVDRTKDAIRRRGENISSMEVENEINAHGDVIECAVVPVASTDTEQEVLAVIVVQPEAQINPESLIRFLEPRLPYFMIPRYIRFADALPKTPTGKIQKYLVRDLGLLEGTWDREVAGVIPSFPKVVSGSLFRQFWNVLGCVWDWFGDSGWVWDGFEKISDGAEQLNFSNMSGSMFPESGYLKITFFVYPRPKISICSNRLQTGSEVQFESADPAVRYVNSAASSRVSLSFPSHTSTGATSVFAARSHLLTSFAPFLIFCFSLSSLLISCFFIARRECALATYPCARSADLYRHAAAANAL